MTITEFDRIRTIEEDTRPKIGWHNIVSSDGTGYGMVGSMLYEAFLRNGGRMVGHTDLDWDVHVCVSPPRSIYIGREKFREDIILHSMFEATPLPSTWPNILNRCGLLWVPSQYVYDLYRDHGVTAPMFKVGYAVDNQMYTFKKREVTDEPFRVLVWGDGLMTRKNVLTSIKAFLKAELPNSFLEVKVSDGIAPRAGIMWNQKPVENVIINSDPWTRLDLVQWLQSGDVGIYLSSGEGYGLMPMEAMATGLPMIIADNTGMREYANKDVALMVDCPTTELSQSLTAAYGESHFTVVPDFDQAVEHLRWAYHNRTQLYELGEKGSAHVTRQTWDEVALAAMYHITEYANSIKRSS